MLSETEPNNALEFLMTELKASFKKCFPIINKKFNSKNSWYDDELHKMHLKMQHLYTKYRRKKSIIAKANYNVARNEYSRLMKIKIKKFYSLLLDKHKLNIRETWKIINSILSKKKQLNCHSLKINNKLTSDFGDISNHFNEFFTSVASKLVQDLPLSSSLSYPQFKTSPCSSQNSLYVFATTPHEINKFISEIKPKKSSGLDEIPTFLLHKFSPNILIALSHIFNLSIAQGVYLDAFKTAKVIPILKKGSALVVNNYRPISLLPELSKILEKIMHRRFYSCLTKKNFFHKLQFGFRKKHSTNHAATALIEYICNAFESKKFAIGVFIDLSKAFDTIGHTILLDKLYKYGIRGSAHNWFHSYLHNRTRQVECVGVLSSTKSILSGVPQGSILGPLLFLMYVNDLPTSLNGGQALMFADDTTLLFSSRSYDSLFNMANSNLENVQEWLIANKLFLNVAKTKYIVFHTPHGREPPCDASSRIRNKAIAKSTSVKFLGIVIQEHSCWKEHMESIIQKVRASIAAVCRVKATSTLIRY